MSSIRVGWCTSQFLPDLGGMTILLGDDEEVKLDSAGQVDCVWSHNVSAFSVTDLDGIEPNGDAPLDHPVFPNS